MQATPDVFLGWHTVKKGDSTRHYYVRQLYDNKAAIAIDQLDESLLVTYGESARGHSRGPRPRRARRRDCGLSGQSPTSPTKPSPPSPWRTEIEY